jgi:hypothetical protein
MGVDPHDVGGSTKPQCHGRERFVVHGERHGHIGDRRLTRSERVHGRDRTGGTLPHPRNETQVR